MEKKISFFIKHYTKTKKYILDLINSFKDPDVPRMVILASIIGVIGGLGAVFFYNLILFFKNIFFGPSTTETFIDVVQSLPWYTRVMIPAIGGLIIGPLITFFVQEAKGHGVPEVMEAVALKGGVIRGRVAPLKAVISAICIGSGGSAGREGPIVQIGSSFGSFVGQSLKLNPQKIETLLGAGAAAGIGATFNAPLAGVMFSLEVLLKDIKMDSFSPIVVASVVGTGVANLFFGNRGAIFDIPTHVIVSFWEVIPYLLLGVVAAGVALLFENSLYSFEHIFEKFPFPEFLKPALGGLLLGILALSVPQVHATGYPVMESALHANLPLRMVIIFMFAKILATNLTLGSGGSGGIFAPSLFIGSMLGSAYGKIVHSLFPAFTAGASSYATVGMGAVFAGATHAPLTSIIILFEMTRDPKIILPLMFSCIVSTVVTSRIQKKNIYTTKLLNRGVDIDAIEKETILQNIKVKDVMDTDFIKLSEEATIKEAKNIFEKTLYTYLPVINEKTKELKGIADFHTIARHWDLKNKGESNIKNIISPSPVYAHENDNLLEVLNMINEIKMQIIPVIADEESHKLIGMVERNDIIEAYHHKISVSQPDTGIDFSPKTTVDTQKLISSSLNIMKKQAEEESIIIDMDLEEDLPPVRADSNKITWVLTDLLGNAIRYTDKGGKIIISAHSSEEWVYISVEDTGKGIPDEEQDRIFEKYVQLDGEENSGSGLGLAICKEIIEAHGGRIWVDSEIGQGSTFTFRLKALKKKQN